MPHLLPNRRHHPGACAKNNTGADNLEIVVSVDVHNVGVLTYRDQNSYLEPSARSGFTRRHLSRFANLYQSCCPNIRQLVETVLAAIVYAAMSACSFVWMLWLSPALIRSGTLPVHCDLHIYENVACEAMCYLTRYLMPFIGHLLSRRGKLPDRVSRVYSFYGTRDK